MKYEVIYTPRSVGDLRGIHKYIDTELLAPAAARNISNNIMSAVEKLDEMPNRFPLYEKQPWKDRGLRKMNVDNFIVFYLPMEKQAQVLVIAIMYGRRDISNVMNDD